MNKKSVTQEQAREIAIIHLASHGSQVDSGAFDDCGLSDNAIDTVLKEYAWLCEQLLKGVPPVASTKEAVDIVMRNK